MPTYSPNFEIYPGAERVRLQAGENTAVFDERSLAHLAVFGLDTFLTKPQTASDIADLLTPDKKMPGINHYGHNNPRIYLLDGPNGEHCVVKPFVSIPNRPLSLDHMSMQELVKDALASNPKYRAASVYASVIFPGEVCYTFDEYIDGPSLAQAKLPISEIPLSKGKAGRVMQHVKQALRDAEMLPRGTSYRDFQSLAGINTFRTCRDALKDFGIPSHTIPAYGNALWDFNNGNLLCERNEQGQARLAIIDQSAPLSAKL